MSEQNHLLDDVVAEMYPATGSTMIDALVAKNAYKNAATIIALVRADERKRIREELLSEDAEAAGFCAYWDNDPPVNGASPSSIQAILKNVAIAIGLTEEPS